MLCHLDGTRVSGRGYLLCITRRSGSTMLADVLGKTQTVARAYEHFFWNATEPVPDWMSPCATLREALELYAQKTPTGFPGIKGDLDQMFPLISEGLFAGPDCPYKHIYLTRRDQIGQAISLARAIETQEWQSTDEPVPDPDLTAGDVVRQLQYLRTMEADWEMVFATLAITPLRIYYEDLVADRPGVLEKIREFLDVQWKVDPASIVSTYESVSGRHDPAWVQNLREQVEALPALPQAGWAPNQRGKAQHP